MLRALPILLLAGLGGCVYNPHEDFSADFGDAVHANIASQVVYPVPLRGEQLMVTVLHPVQTDFRRSKGWLCSGSRKRGSASISFLHCFSHRSWHS